MNLTRQKQPFAFAALAVALLLVPVGCSKEPENLANQIGPITCTIGPNVDGDGKPIQEVRYTFKNNGPKEVGAVYAKTNVYDAAGNLTGDSTQDYCIFGSESPADRLKPGQAYRTPVGQGYLLLHGTAATVEAHAVNATQTNPVEAKETK